MFTPLPPDRNSTVSAFRHGYRLHTARQLAGLELEHVHPFAHDEIVVWIHGSIGLVFDERHER